MKHETIEKNVGLMDTGSKVTKLHKVSSACHMCHAKDLCMSSCFNVDDLQKFDDIVGHRKPMQRGERLFMAGENI